MWLYVHNRKFLATTSLLVITMNYNIPIVGVFLPLQNWCLPQNNRLKPKLIAPKKKKKKKKKEEEEERQMSLPSIGYLPVLKCTIYVIKLAFFLFMHLYHL